MKLVNIAIAVVILVLMFGCAASIDNTMKSWMGHNQSDLIASWGPPQQVMDDGQGGKILVYTAQRNFTTPGTATTSFSGSSAQTTYNPPQTSSCAAHRMFWVSADGVMYR